MATLGRRGTGLPDMMPRPHARPPIPALLGRPLSWVYGAVIARRNRRFDRRTGVIEFDRPTISIGNLSVGGTGKTPMVMHVVGVLKRAGLSPCIAMRGYRSAGGESDEAAEYARGVPGVPVVVRANRVEGLIKLFGSEAGERVDAIVLDDGFQHRRIARDLDVVFADALLPLGWLREPVASLGRAGAVVITHAEGADASRVREIEREVARVNASTLVAICEHAWTGLRGISEDRNEPVSWLRGKSVVVACAIGNPHAFVAQVACAVGREPVASILLRDHDPFHEGTVDQIITKAMETRADAVVMTNKDVSKLNPEEVGWPCPVVRPQLEMRFVSGGEEFDRLVIDRVRARPQVPVEDFLGTDDEAPVP